MRKGMALNSTIHIKVAARYLKQPYKDNYVDASFLDSLVLNANVQRYEPGPESYFAAFARIGVWVQLKQFLWTMRLRALCFGTLPIIRQLSLVVIFVNARDLASQVRVCQCAMPVWDSITTDTFPWIGQRWLSGHSWKYPLERLQVWGLKYVWFLYVCVCYLHDLYNIIVHTALHNSCDIRLHILWISDL